MITGWNDNKQSIGRWDKLDNYISLIELDCKNYNYRMVNTVYYDVDGEKLHEIDNPSPKTQNIPPESIVEKLFNKVCK